MILRRVCASPQGPSTSTPLASGPRRPLHFEAVGAQRGRIEVALEREGNDCLAAWLANVTQFDQRTGAKIGAGFLGKLASCRRGGILARLDEALGNRPGRIILLRPERPARMDEQHFELLGSAPKQQDT